MDEKILNPAEDESATNKKISELAKERGIGSWELLEMFHKAEMKHDDEDSVVSFKEWKQFLDYQDELMDELKHKEAMREEIRPIDNIVLRMIIEVVRTFVIIIWAVVGLFFWIPLLGRVTTVFSVAIFSSVLKGGSTHNAQMQLDKASKFYINGFIKINKSISSIITGGYIDDDHSNKRIPISKGAMFFEVLFSLVFWFVAISAVLGLFGELRVVTEWVFNQINGIANTLSLPSK